ncbi:peroxiredoxin-like family protein [Methylobacterium isbiliense]|uniref:thioredoxin-dependent peroxiredoxin n=1 Tax=Methylobacterium isbiliense TaxID=315478 RepID=A0ABQ4SMU4_9HYPH|nr:peroxiredoxin-like family protein [Methylobacterium isbiliense]MDN3622690.1 peroxiredoxin-like family protein [Methylobacterium isbiliense]GJE03631.1 Thiol-disulfide oxidoreductase ResA [Methylobacterium isbiliense]
MTDDLSATSLAEHIAEFTSAMTKQAPPEVVAKLGIELEKLASSGIAKQALATNGKAPDFSLPDTQGRPTALSSLLARGPVVLTFYRGGWCPFCDLQLRAYQRILPEIHGLGAELVAISPQTADYALSDVEKKQLTPPVLHDSGNRVARSYGLVFTLSDALKELQTGFGNPLPKFNGDQSWELPMPGTFVLDRDGSVKFAHVDPNYMVRAEPAAILDVLRQLHAEGGA